jgi:hypothetical protein
MMIWPARRSAATTSRSVWNLSAETPLSSAQKIVLRMCLAASCRFTYGRTDRRSSKLLKNLRELSLYLHQQRKDTVIKSAKRTETFGGRMRSLWNTTWPLDASAAWLDPPATLFNFEQRRNFVPKPSCPHGLQCHCVQVDFELHIKSPDNAPTLFMVDD